MAENRYSGRGPAFYQSGRPLEMASVNILRNSSRLFEQGNTFAGMSRDRHELGKEIEKSRLDIGTLLKRAQALVKRGNDQQAKSDTGHITKPSPHREASRP